MLELVGDDGTAAGQLGGAVHGVIRRHHDAVGDRCGRAVGIRVEDRQPVAHRARREPQHPPQLPAAQDPERGAGGDRVAGAGRATCALHGELECTGARATRPTADAEQRRVAATYGAPVERGAQLARERVRRAGSERATPAQYPCDVEPLRTRALVRATAVGVAALGGATLLVALLQDGLGVPNPSAVYILAVAVVALVGGRVAVLLRRSPRSCCTTSCSSSRA